MVPVKKLASIITLTAALVGTVMAGTANAMVVPTSTWHCGSWVQTGIKGINAQACYQKQFVSKTMHAYVNVKNETGKSRTIPSITAALIDSGGHALGQTVCSPGAVPNNFTVTCSSMIQPLNSQNYSAGSVEWATGSFTQVDSRM
ncbi:hypothetical protein [Streptomyces sp. NPDC057909]|uniref:hypothetical protein n=1 Tax=Streptomyces sp. NPDC057909 TaxID=3346277 RepID=UPI0036EBA7D6